MRRSRGFTLIELLVALAIVAIIGAMAFGGLNMVLNQREIAQERVARWREIQLAMRLVMQDVVQLHPRPVREEFGTGHLPSVLSTANSQFALELSRGGWPNPGGFARGNVARVAYDWEDDKFVRYHWPILDRTPDTLPVRTELLDGVIAVEVRFLSSGGAWQTTWPAFSGSGASNLATPQEAVARPRAIEFMLELEDFGRVWRVMETTG